jgi:tRNA nucleotidyltransferase (CCA-adding enzyme)
VATNSNTQLVKYLVGGCVRDKLLNLTPKDRDWVVVGSSSQQMLALGFRQVGRDFPVFLHPHTKEEYALARIEKKSAPGHTGFQVYADSTVTLEQDLARRDLTINSIAMTEDGRLIDPFHGVQDLKQGILRHTSSAFTEDPLRVLRLARFGAQMGFEIAPETVALARDIAASGELTCLSPERVWQELQKALSGTSPATFIQILRQLNALEQLFPEIDCLFGIPQTEKYHPEIDTGIHLLLALNKAADLSSDPLIRFAVLVHDLGKGVTPDTEWPRHIAHEAAGVPLVKALCKRYCIPNHYCRLGQNTSAWHLQAHQAMSLKPRTLVKLFERLDAFRRPDDLERFILACQADAQGRKGFSRTPYPQADYLRRTFQAASQISAAAIVAEGKQGQAVGDELRARRVRAVREAKERFSP